MWSSGYRSRSICPVKLDRLSVLVVRMSGLLNRSGRFRSNTLRYNKYLGVPGIYYFGRYVPARSYPNPFACFTQLLSCFVFLIHSKLQLRVIFAWSIIDAQVMRVNTLTLVDRWSCADGFGLRNTTLSYAR